MAGTLKNGPSADFLGNLFDAFPDVTPTFLFHYSTEMVMNEKSEKYQIVRKKRNTETDEIISIKAQLDLMRNLYEQTLEKLILLQNSLKRE